MEVEEEIIKQPFAITKISTKLYFFPCTSNVAFFVEDSEACEQCLIVLYAEHIFTQAEQIKKGKSFEEIYNKFYEIQVLIDRTCEKGY